MSSRKPAAGTDILNKSLNAGKAYKAVSVLATAADPNQNFGAIGGIFPIDMPATPGASLQFIPVYAIRIYDAIFQSKGANVAAESVTVSKVTPAGVATPLFTISFTGTAKQIIRPTELANTFADMTLAQGDAIKVSSVSGVTGAYQVIVMFHNV